MPGRQSNTATVLHARMLPVLSSWIFVQHFHYSYLLNAAAVLAKLRPVWAAGNNKEFVETLIRDVNTPSVVSGSLSKRKTQLQASTLFVIGLRLVSLS